MSPTLQEVEDLARRAGAILKSGFVRRPGFEPSLKVEYKSLLDPVTEVDHRSEAFLLGEIQACFAGHRIITEESGVLSGEDCCRWYIDPLDGTVNFAHGVPIFCVSIAYAEGDHLVFGAVYDPMQDELFSAERGKGAWLNGESIRVSSTESLNRSLLVTGFPYDIRTNPDNNLENYARLSLLTQGVRRLGSAAIDLCYVAAGRFESFWELALGPWDLAAGALIAREAGATVTDRRGDPDFLKPPYSILAANPILHPQLLKILN
jgi:myo-inositol-1(or 4)-monophosphatase